jgi:hypothetical protein
MAFRPVDKKKAAGQPAAFFVAVGIGRLGWPPVAA